MVDETVPFIVTYFYLTMLLGSNVFCPQLMPTNCFAAKQPMQFYILSYKGVVHMFFRKKSAAPALPSVRILSGEQVIYEGLLKDIPIRENVLIEKSIYFFDDPEPCFIHLDAVRLRLTEELHQELLRENTGSPGSLLLSYADLSGITSCELL